MAIGIRTSGTSNTAAIATSISVDKPSGATAGDVAVAAIAISWNFSGPCTTSAPSGWTAIAENVGDSSSSNGERVSA